MRRKTRKKLLFFSPRAIKCLGIAVAIVVLCLLCFCASYWIRARRYNLDDVAKMPARTLVYGCRGKIKLGELHGENRYLITYEELSPFFVKALIAREDARFYKHGAVDWYSMLRVIQRAVMRGKREGGSTLTMQLARNSFELGGKTLDRKLLEIAVAIRIEHAFTKQDILTHYVNRIFFGHSIRGIEAAARTYYGKRAKHLSLAQSALLAGIIRGPNLFSPFKNPQGALRERNTTLGRMVHYGFITQQQAEEAKKEPLGVRKNARILEKSSVMDAVSLELKRILVEKNIRQGGLRVITTIDPVLQRGAERVMEQRLAHIERQRGFRHSTRADWLKRDRHKRGAPDYLQGACVFIETHSGAIRTFLTARNTKESSYDRAKEARRQVGSTFKPFVYLAAFMKGALPGTWVSNARILPGEINHVGGAWSPANSDGRYEDIITVEKALITSKNTATVRVGNFVGIKPLNALAKDVGFIQGIRANASSYLGAWEGSVLQVASAYGIFSTLGEWYRPYMIAEIRDAKGKRLYPDGTSSGKLLVIAAPSEECSLVAGILEKVITQGTGRRVRSMGFLSPAGGKTGTTNNYRDAWFAGYTQSLSGAVWVGFDTPKKIISKGYGSRLALPIWVDIMALAGKEGYPMGKLPKHASRPIVCCAVTGKQATIGCQEAHTAYIENLPAKLIPKDSCKLHGGGRRLKVAPKAILVE